LAREQKEKDERERKKKQKEQEANDHEEEDLKGELRPTTAKKGPPRKKMGDNFDKIVVEEHNTMPEGIILDNDDNNQEEEKNTSFDNNVVTRNVNVNNIDKNQHGYLVREIMDKNEEEKEKREEPKDADGKAKIRMGRIGKKKETPQQQTNQGGNDNATYIQIKVESIEDVEALRKAVQNVCQYANPLGRLMEQFVDDVGNMDKEFE